MRRKPTRGGLLWRCCRKSFWQAEYTEEKSGKPRRRSGRLKLTTSKANVYEGSMKNVHWQKYAFKLSSYLRNKTNIVNNIIWQLRFSYLSKIRKTKTLWLRKMLWYNIFVCKGNEILKANVIVYGHQSNTSLEIMNSILYTLGPILRPT